MRHLLLVLLCVPSFAAAAEGPPASWTDQWKARCEASLVEIPKADLVTVEARPRMVFGAVDLHLAPGTWRYDGETVADLAEVRKARQRKKALADRLGPGAGLGGYLPKKSGPARWQLTVAPATPMHQLDATLDWLARADGIGAAVVLARVEPTPLWLPDPAFDAEVVAPLWKGPDGGPPRADVLQSKLAGLVAKTAEGCPDYGRLVDRARKVPLEDRCVAMVDALVAVRQACPGTADRLTTIHRRLVANDNLLTYVGFDFAPDGEDAGFEREQTWGEAAQGVFAKGDRRLRPNPATP